MGWEVRKGKRYFYRKVKVAGRVRSIYVGSEESAGELIRREEERKQGEERRHFEFRRRRSDILVTFATVEAAVKQIELLMCSVLLSEGFHFTANSEWRFRHAKRKNG